MEFALSQEQRLLRESVGRFLEDAAPLDKVRQVADGDAGVGAAIWQGLVEMGVPGMVVPEAYGGMGLGFLDAAMVSEMLGRHVAPVPFAGACVMAPLAIDALGSDGQRQDLLPKIAAGTLKIGVGVSERIGAREGAGLRASGGKLSGKALFVLDCADADMFLVADETDGLHLVSSDAAGLTVNGLATIDRTRAVGELLCDNTPAAPLTGSNRAIVSHVINGGRVMLAADMLGSAQMMIEKAVAYAAERKQFGRVIGSFQAVKHMCAEMAAGLEPCHALVWYAAHALDEIPEEAPLMAAHAKAHLSEVTRFVARTSTEVHGGMGFTDLVGLHYWFKRIGFDRQVLGGPEQVRLEAATLQGWAA